MRLSKSKEKKFFIEKIKIYMRHIEVLSQMHFEPIKLNSEIIPEAKKRLKELEFISNEDPNSLEDLKMILKDELFYNLLNCIKFDIDNKKIIGKSLLKIDPIKREIHKKKFKNKKNLRVADFFCGAGGLSLGFIQAGYQIELANDIDPECIETFKYNHPEIDQNKIILDDINNIVEKIDSLRVHPIDVVIGGPPCQGFSSANQQRIIDDPRNNLYKSFIKAVEKLSPKIVVMENVRGMLPYAQQVKEDFKKIKGEKKCSYDLEFQVLVSDDFGVAQKRQRLIFIAIRNDISEKKGITSSHIFKKINKENLGTKKYNLKNALSDIKPLKAPRKKNMTETDDDESGKKIDLNYFEKNDNSYLKLINLNSKSSFLFNHKARYVNDINFEIYSTLKPGDDGTNKKIQHVMPYKHRNHIFKDKYYKLEENKPCKTITAHLRMDCHSHIHPTQTRSLTPREAARIQSFPDDYLFLGSYLKTYMQIGNAVPPLMAKSIAKHLKKVLK